MHFAIVIDKADAPDQLIGISKPDAKNVFTAFIPGSYCVPNKSPGVFYRFMCSKGKVSCRFRFAGVAIKNFLSIFVP
jgi:hypothetical protein